MMSRQFERTNIVTEHGRYRFDHFVKTQSLWFYPNFIEGALISVLFVKTFNGGRCQKTTEVFRKGRQRSVV